MLESLLNSKLKKFLLAIFFASPKRSFTATELRLITNTGTRQAPEALREFNHAGVIDAVRYEQRRFYRANPHFRLYDELKDLVDEEKHQYEDLVVKQIKKVPDLKLAILSGIFVLQPHLPADILLVGSKLNRLRVQKQIAEIEKITGGEVRYTVMDKEEYEYRRMMNDRFVRDILDYPNLTVVNLLKK